jgi:hypothetical protein
MEEDAQVHSAFSNRRKQPARDPYSLRMNSNHKPDSQTLNLLVIFVEYLCGKHVWHMKTSPTFVPLVCARVLAAIR